MTRCACQTARSTTLVVGPVGGDGVSGSRKSRLMKGDDGNRDSRLGPVIVGCESIAADRSDLSNR